MPRTAPILALLTASGLLLLLLLSLSGAGADCPDSAVIAGVASTLSPKRMLELDGLLNELRLRQLTGPILVERPVGSANHTRVRDYIVQFMRSLGWLIELDSFEQSTPIGIRRFVNVVATAPTSASKRLVLAAHYDSKLQENFVGATDSAVPCGMLLQLAESWKAPASADVGLQLVFFDGEEAFVEWTSEDSIYGARHLAAALESAPGVGACRSAIREIDCLALLDLIGYSNPTFYYNRHSGDQRVVAKERSLFQRLISAETRLRNERLLNDSDGHVFFRSAVAFGGIEDDHLPFRARSVPIVHAIAQPFPPVWHKAADSADVVNWRQTRALQLILRVWLGEYLGEYDD